MLSRSLFREVREYYGWNFKYDAMLVKDTVFFEQLKPRLKIQVLDYVFNNFYDIFHFIFEGCGMDFQREIYGSSAFNYFGENIDQEDELGHRTVDDEVPVIEQSGKVSQAVHFIISGCAHVMDKDGLYQYGVLSQGNYFGDISILLD